MGAPQQEVHSGVLRVLVVEDCEPDARSAMRELQEAGFNCTYRCVESEGAMRTALQCELPDLILSDFSFPKFDGMSALAVAISEAPHVPFIFLTGMAGEALAIEALKGGAVDYILKSNTVRLVPAVARALQGAKLRRSRKAADVHATHLSAVLQMLSRINTALVRIHNRDELLSEICAVAHKLGGYPVAMVALINPSTRLARPVSWAGYNFLTNGEQEFPVGQIEADDTSLMGRVIRSGQLTLVPDISRSHLPIMDREELIGVGVQSLVCLPLKVDSTPVGSFLFGMAAPGEFSPDELLLLQEVASNLSFALQYLERQDAVQFLSYFDPLTGLAKRPLFCERLTRLLSHGTEHLRIAIAVFDIENLRVVNDAQGRHAGDRLLQSVSDRLKRHFVDTDRLAHLGGGTFATVSAVKDQSADEPQRLPYEITAIFGAPFNVDGLEIGVTIKSGVACFPENGRDPDQLVQNAEAALKGAKTAGEPYLHHRLEMNSELARRVALEHRLRSALENNEFVLHYQPKVTLRSGKVAGVEALLRWNDIGDVLLEATGLLSILESAGLMPAVGAWVLRQAVADCRRWQRMGVAPLRVAVNISPPELKRRNAAKEFLDDVGDLAASSNWGIDVDITESALFGDAEQSIHALRVLRAAGVRIAIDDFGTGYSSLGRLSELPIDTLKIDRVFINRLPEDPKTCMLVKTIIGLAHAFDMTTVAEGVEKQAQLDYLISAGCDESQGYLHSRALPREELEAHLGLLPPSCLNDYSKRRAI